MTNEAIERWLAKHAHGQEIGLRVGVAREVLTELIELRLKDQIRSAPTFSTEEIVAIGNKLSEEAKA